MENQLLIPLFATTIVTGLMYLIVHAYGLFEEKTSIIPDKDLRDYSDEELKTELHRVIDSLPTKESNARFFMVSYEINRRQQEEELLEISGDNFASMRYYRKHKELD